MDNTWFQVLTIVLANAGISIGMFLWIRTEANADRRDMCGLIREIQIEMKEFHTKLATQDLEFKMRLCAIEQEKNKK